MKRIVEIAVLVPGMFLIPALDLSAALDAKASYQIIVDRNPFGLRPPPPPPSLTQPDAPPPKPPATFKLVGIMSIQSPKKVLILKTEAAPNSKPKYLRIEEGGRDDQVDVLEIDAKNGTVKIEYAGATTLLKFEKENVKAAMAGAPGGPYAAMPGGVPPPPYPGYGGNPNATYPNTAYPTTATGVPGLPNRFTGGQPPPAAYNASAPGGAIPPPSLTPLTPNIQLNPGSSEPIRTVPLRQLRINGVGGVPQSSSPPTPEPVDPAVQTIMIEVNRQATQSQVEKGELPPLPPTDFPTGPQ